MLYINASSCVLFRLTWARWYQRKKK